MLKPLEGKTAVITGGSRGLGEAIAYKLASMGADIAVICSSSVEDGEKVCEKCIQEFGVKAKAYQCDVADFEAVKELAGLIKADFKTAHILVNNAGITRDGLAVMMKEEDFDRVIAVNLKGAFNTIRAASNIMLKQRSGAIINMSSVSGLIGNVGQANYSASKAGLIGLTKSAARELAARGVTVNAIAPGFISTDMTAVLSDNIKDEMMKNIPLKRFGEAEDVAKAAVFLAENRYITGQVLNVDGGMVMN